MTQFLCIAALLFAVAAALLARPLWWRAGTRRSAALTRDVDALGVQLRQLGALHAAGALTDEQFAQSKALVERKLIDALVAEPGSASTAAPAGPTATLTAGLVVFMLAVAGGGYALIGSPRDLAVGPGLVGARDAGGDAGQADAGGAPHELTAAQINDMVDRLADRLKTHPDDADGWQMLARSQVALGRHAQALEAFAQAERLRPDDASLLADHADALAMTRARNLQGEPLALIERALKLDAHNNKALALAGSAAFDRKDYKAAVGYWETLAKVEPADGPFADQVNGGIAEARKLAGMPPAPAPAPAPASAPQAALASLAGALGASVPATAAAAANASVAGTVTLAPALTSRVSPDDTVFVFARAVDGPRMPLAILRKQVKDLPLQFTLDDSLAMSPTATLSSVPKVIVGARISRTGNATVQDGDLQGLGTAVAVGATGLRIEINQQVTR
jgi:cytochrome c-type biogenesis protein CcmH